MFQNDYDRMLLLKLAHQSTWDFHASNPINLLVPLFSVWGITTCFRTKNRVRTGISLKLVGGQGTDKPCRRRERLK